DSADAHVLLANADAGLQNLEESLSEMQKAIELAPDQPRSYVNLAILQLDAKDAVAAEQNFQKAISLDPKSITARFAVGNFYRSQRRRSEEHTSELQSPYDLVCRLLLEKKKNTK